MMTLKSFWLIFATACLGLQLAIFASATSHAQTQAAAPDQAVPQEQEPLSEEELEVLVARIALYPDELVAVISGASLFPLQIVEAARYLDDYAKDKTLKPKDSWDGSVISLLNYPEIVKMMSQDLDWTQALGDALTYQQKDVLVAIQQLREEAVAKGIIKSDDKMTVTEDDENVIIQSTNKEAVYVPQYPPEMLYEPNYAPAPITYYPEPYPNYFWPTATFFAATVTGAIWAATVDWDDWGVYGGQWNGGNVDIDCNRCFNNVDINGKLNINDIDWKNVDRSKINFDRNQINNLDRTNIKNNLKADRTNNLRDKSASLRKDRPTARPTGGAGTRDVRKSTLEGLKTQQRPAASTRQAAANRPQAAGNKPQARKQAGATRQGGKKKPAAKVDKRPKKASGLGNVSQGKKQKVASKRGGKSMGGGNRGGAKQFKGGGGRGGGGGRRR